MQHSRLTPAMPLFAGPKDRNGKTENLAYSKFVGQPNQTERKAAQPVSTQSSTSTQASKGSAKSSAPTDIIHFTQRSPLAREARVQNALSDLQELVMNPGQLMTALAKGTLSIASQGKELLVKMAGKESTQEGWIAVEDKETIEALRKAEQEANQAPSKSTKA